MSQLVRPARMTDLEALMALSAASGNGMTTMPQSHDAMADRIAQSEASFAKPLSAPDSETYMLVLEEGSAVIGLSCLFTGLGATRPFYNYRVARTVRTAPELDIRTETDVLHLVNDFHGYAELGTLFLHPSHRGGGRGRLLSLARLMLIASDPPRFGDRLMAEIRGRMDGNHSPFWEAVGRNFFNLEFQEADQHSAQDYRFIADLMPPYPIYTCLLPDAAQAAIGQPHAQAEGALKLLCAQGFRYHNMIDIFDAGPCVEARADDVPLIRQTQSVDRNDLDTLASDGPGFVANPSLDRFAVSAVSTATCLGLEAGETGLYAPLETHS